MKLETPFLRACHEWDERYSHLSRGKRNWQLAALGLLAANLVLSLSLAGLASTSRVTPYVVEVDRLGQAVSFGPAERLRQTDERLVRYLLGRYVADLRTVLTDPEVQKTLLDRVYDHTRGPAVAFLNRYFARHNPFETARQERVRVEVESLLPLSETSWQAQWREIREGLPGGGTTETTWQGILTVEIDPPETPETLLTNPLGLYVTEIHWTRTFGGDSP